MPQQGRFNGLEYDTETQKITKLYSNRILQARYSSGQIHTSKFNYYAIYVQLAIHTLLAYTLLMKSVFVESTIFEKYRNDYLSDEEFRLFQAELMSNPKQGDVIQGTGGLRKIRVASKGKGKRGGLRVIYYFLDEKRRFYLLTIYGKNEMADLTADQKKQLKAFMEAWCNEQS